MNYFFWKLKNIKAIAIIHINLIYCKVQMHLLKKLTCLSTFKKKRLNAVLEQLCKTLSNSCHLASRLTLQFCTFSSCQWMACCINILICKAASSWGKRAVFPSLETKKILIIKQSCFLKKVFISKLVNRNNFFSNRAIKL